MSSLSTGQSGLSTGLSGLTGLSGEVESPGKSEVLHGLVGVVEIGSVDGRASASSSGVGVVLLGVSLGLLS